MVNRHVAGVWGTAAPLVINNTDLLGGTFDSRIAIDGSDHVFAMWRQIFDDSLDENVLIEPDLWSNQYVVGTGVIGGMLLATFVATLFIPSFYVWAVRLGARKQAIEGKHDKQGTTA